MTDRRSTAERDAFAREACTAIEAVLEQRCSGTKIASWIAVDHLHRRDRRLRAAPAPWRSVGQPRLAGEETLTSVLDGVAPRGTGQTESQWLRRARGSQALACSSTSRDPAGR